VTTEAADVLRIVAITPREVEFPEIGKAPDVVPSAVPVLPVYSAVTVTTETADVLETVAMTPGEVEFSEIGKAPDVAVPSEMPVLPEDSAVIVTTEAPDDVLDAEVRTPDEVAFPGIGKASAVVLPASSAVTVTTEAAGDVFDPELKAPDAMLPDTGNAPDFVAPSEVPVPEGSAVTVTTEAADDVPGAPELAAGTDVLVGGAVSVPLGGQAVTVTSGLVVGDEPEPEGRLAETGNALDVAALSVVPVLPEDPALSVTVPAGSSVPPGPGAVTVTVFGVSSVSKPKETLEAGHEDTGAVTVTVPGTESGCPGIPIETPTERPTDTDISDGMGTGSVGQAGPPEVSLLSKDRPEELAADPVARLDVNKSDTLGKIVMVTGSFRVAVGALKLLSAGSA